MAGKIPVGTFNTRISLDGEQPIQTLKSLKNEVSSATSAWKAQVAELKSAGDQLGAAKAKYEGLGNTLKKQQSLLERNKSELNSLKEAQSKVDTSTEKGRNEYERYSKEIATAERNVANATTRIAKLSQQQEKARNSLDYYKSGLASAQSELKKITESSSAYVGRLEAEGKHEEANKAKLSGLSREYDKLNEVYKIQSNELAKIASEAGKSSEAYRRQKVRVDETATSLAKTKSEMSGLSSEMKKAHPSIFDRMKAKITGVNGEAKKTHSLFKTIFSASFFSNMTSNAFSSATSGLKSIITSGMQLDGVIGKVRAQWAGLGKNKNDTQILVDQMGYLKSNTAMTGDEVHQLQLNMNRLTNGNLSHTLALSKSIATIGDATKMTSGEMVGLSSAMARALSGSKVSAMQWQRMSKQAPGLGAALSKAAGMSEEAFGKMVTSGKMSTKQFEELVEKAGQDGGKAFANFKKTQGGAAKSMQDSWNSLKAKMAQPLFDVKTSGMQQLADLMQSKPVQDGAEMLGVAIQKVAKLGMQALGYIAKHKGDIVGIGSDLMSITKDIAIDTWKTLSKIIVDIAEAFGLTSKNALKSKDPLKQLRVVLDNLAKNKEAIQWISKAIIAIAAIRTLKPVANGLFSIASGSVKAYKGVKALHAGFKGLDTIKELKGPEGALAKIGSGAKTAFSKISSGFKTIASVAKSTASKMWSSFKDIFAKIGSGAKNALSGKSFGGAFQSLKSAGGFSGLSTAGKVATGVAGVGVALDAGSSILSAFKDKKGSMKQYQDAGKGIGSAIGGGIGLFFGGPAGAAIGSQIGKIAGGWGGKATKEFLNGWKSKKPPKNFWSIENLGWSTKDALSKAGKGIDSWWKGIQKSNKKAQAEQKKAAEQAEKQRQKEKKAWDKYWSNVGKGFEKFGKDSKKNLDKSVKNAQNFTKKLGPNIKKGYDTFLKNGHNFFKKFNTNLGNFFKSIPKNRYVKAFQKGKLFQTAYKDISKQTPKWTKDFNKSWSKHWKSTQKTVSRWAKDTRKNYDKGTKSLQKSFKSWSKNAKKSWNSHWTSLHKSVSDFWTKSKKATSDGTKKLLDKTKDYAKKSGKEWLEHHSYVTDISDDFQKNLKKNHGNMLEALKKTTGDQLHKIANSFSDKWNAIKRDTARKWSDMKSNASNWGRDMHSWFDGFNKKWRTGWSNLGKGIQNIFSGMWKSMQKLGKNAMNGLIDIVNGGIGAVNDVIFFFGGGHSTVKKLPHFATGTGYFGSQRRAITEPTLAMVNDGNDSPETGNKESLYRPATGEFGIFQGRNTTTMLMPGDEILNATDTKNLMNAMGIARFANGGISSFFGNIGKNVGNFFGGIGSWAKDTMEGMKKFFEKAKEIISHPQKALDGIFKWTGVKGLSRGAFHTMITKGFDKGKKQVSAFWKTLWNMVSSSLDGEAEGGLLGAVEKYGKDKPYVWGAEGPDSFDCSGLVKYALEKAFGKSFPHYSGDQYSASRAVKDPQIGDLVFFGPGGRNHVGVYAAGGKIWSAMNPSSGIGMAKISDFQEGAVSYRRIPGLKNESGDGDVKANSGLEKFIKGLKPLKGFFSFISKIGDLFGLGGDEKDPNGTGADRWGEDIKKAAETMHTSVTPTEIRKIISMIAGESRGNPSAVQPGADPDGDGSGPARGLLQYKTRTFNAYKVRGHGNIYHGWDQLLALFNDSNWRNDIHFGAGWGPTGHARYANGGIANQPSIFGEAGPEMAIPLSAVKSSRSYELLGKTAAIVAARDNIQPTTVNTGSLGEKLDKIIDLLTAILTAPATVETSINVDKQALGNSITEVVNARMRLNSINRKKGISVIR
ncbi:NlpC/P60 family protein [Lactobacillus gasseri]|uniref:tape measure protein n=1 Tax=Lactobacillus gasseri TaxID=1596 RepID=UPI0028EA2D73|nr:tape measure protein [Lactobacillus gasseri]MDT9589664.1 NlpC/P60 family protein [Lactobacillus gasseri]MDT9610954.1 NlpC/P60 family protein [Lactobacillus gasseri]